MRQFLKQCRIYFTYAGLFSLCVNLLMLTLPLFMLQLFDRVITSRSEETLWLLTLAAVGAFVFHGVLDVLRGRLLVGGGIALDELAGPPVLAGALNAAARPGSSEFTAGLRDVAVLRGFLTGRGIIALFDVPWVPIFLAIIYLFHPLLGIMATVGGGVMFALAVVNEKTTRRPLDEMASRTRQASAYIDAGMRNAEVVSALGMLENLAQRWGRMNHQVLDSQLEAHDRTNTLTSLSRTTRLALQVLMLGVGAMLVIRQHVSPGIMIAATLILSRALAPIESAIVSWKGLVSAREAFERLERLLADNPLEREQFELPPPRGRIELENVSYALRGADRFIIRNVSFKLEPGELLGLIGPSAAGKSTLVRLTIGVWRPTAGTVRLDGADVSTWPRRFVGQYLGYVPQDVELFSGTIGENIARLGTPDPEQVIAAARRAHAHEMIMRLPNAYDTQIGTGGGFLSAGQQQRVALARALYGEPRVVILDEPNANLDTEGEEALVRSLRDLKAAGVTVIVISHRPSILAGMDKLLVLRDGQVEMYGPKSEVFGRVVPRGGPRTGEGPQVVAGGRPA